MARTIQAQLDALDAVIATMEVTGVELYKTSAEKEVRMTKLADFYTERDRLTQRLRDETPGQFRLAEPFLE